MNSRTDTNTTRHTVHRPTRDEFIRCGFAQRIAYDKSTARSRHLAENRFRHLNRQHEEGESYGHRDKR
jgi:hypothetical protein